MAKEVIMSLEPEEILRRLKNAIAYGHKMMVFDWDKAAEIIKNNPKVCWRAALRNDEFWTGDTIYEDGKPNLDAHTYLASIWAVPYIFNDEENICCYKYSDEVPDWNSDTIWPKSALEILNDVRG